MDQELKKVILTAVFMALYISSKAQSPYEGKASIGLAAGYSGFRQNMLEVGIGFQPWEAVDDSGMDFVRYPFAGFLLLYEISPEQKLYGTSFNLWYLSGIFACGLNVNRYSNYENETYGIKPMIGISGYRVGLMYGYNIYLSDPIPGLSHSSLTIKYYLPLLRKKN